MSKARKTIRIYKNGGIYIDLPWQIDTGTTWLRISVMDQGKVESRYHLAPLNSTTELLLERIPDKTEND